MCGIIGHIPKKKGASPEAIVNQFQEQHNRGKEGFGLIELSRTLKPTVHRATEPVKALLDIRMSKADILLFHHRYPTSTDNKMKQTHPLFVSHPELHHDYYVIHNGVLRNQDELFTHHTEELGYVYSTHEPAQSYTGSYGHTYRRAARFNDSEAFAIEFARYIEGKEKEINVHGTVAFIALRLNKKTKKADTLFYGRNSDNPLELLETDSGLLIASQIYNSNAEILTPDTFEAIDLMAFYKEKPRPTDILGSGLVKSYDLKFTPEPRKVGYGTYRTSTAQSSVGKTQHISETTETEKENKHDVEMSPRAAAFQRMANRVIRDISSDISDIFENMAYYQINEDEATQLASNLKDLILEKEELANAKIRPQFDEREAEELYSETGGWTPDYHHDIGDDIPEPTTQELAAIEEDDRHQQFLTNLR